MKKYTLLCLSLALGGALSALNFEKLPNLDLPPAGDYQQLHGDAYQLIERGYSVENAIYTSFSHSPNAAFRKVQRLTTAAVRYLTSAPQDDELNLEINSALAILTPQERYQLEQIYCFPKRYLAPYSTCSVIDRFARFYAHYLGQRQGVKERLERYYTTGTWLSSIPKNTAYRTNNVARYFWLSFKTILSNPAVAAQELLAHPEDNPGRKILIETLRSRAWKRTPNLIQIDFYNEYLD